MARFGNWLAPTIGFGMTAMDPINDREKYDFMQNNSKDKDDFAFKKSITALELEYLF